MTLLRSAKAQVCNLGSHVGIIMQGKFEMTMLDSGAKVIAEPGQCYVCEPGHHAAVVGDEPVVFVEFESKRCEMEGRVGGEPESGRPPYPAQPSYPAGTCSATAQEARRRGKLNPSM